MEAISCSLNFNCSPWINVPDVWDKTNSFAFVAATYPVAPLLKPRIYDDTGAVLVIVPGLLISRYVYVCISYKYKSHWVAPLL